MGFAAMGSSATSTPAGVDGGAPFVIHTFEHRAYPVPPDRPFTIGRDSACDIKVNEVAVSRRHAEVQQEEGRFTLVPTGSTTTILNGTPLTDPQPLHEGDTFFVGTMKFIFTRDRLPVAMAVARPAHRERVVEDRRPTLTFPTQPAVMPPGESRAALWVALVVVIALAAAVAYWLTAAPRR